MIHEGQSSSICSSSISTVRSAVSLGSGLYRPSAIQHDEDESVQTVLTWFPPKVDKISASNHSAVSTVSLSDDFSDDEFEFDSLAWNSSDVEKTVQLWNLSPQERADLIRMGHRLQDIDHSKNNPADVIRFIRARQGDLDAAEKMFRAMINWRIENKIDTILQDYVPSPELLSLWPGAVLQGVDKDGDPIHLAREGKIDGPAWLKRFGHDELLRFCIWLREKPQETPFFQNYESTYGHPVKRFTIIEDVGGIRVQNFTNKASRNLLGQITRLDQDYYPENAKKIIIIGVPSAFMAVWKTIKYLFDQGTVDKMIFSTSQTALKVLSEYVDLEVLPACIAPGIGRGKAIEGLPSNF